MFEIKGKYAKAIVFADIIEEEATSQSNELCNHIAFKDANIRIMPDVHSGSGCVIGFTADLGEKVVPNLVGVDIGCGIRTVNLGCIDIDFEKLDAVIREFVPAGFAIHKEPVVAFETLNELICKNDLNNLDRIQKSIGTLGGGNHFIECDIDPDTGCKYLIIHTGSRNLGKQVAEHYQKLAMESCSTGAKTFELQKALIKEHKANGKESEINDALMALREEAMTSVKIPKKLSYLVGADREAYLHDMRICQEYAKLNRKIIANTIIRHMGWNAADSFETIHNYIDHDKNIVRKGAISAKLGEQVLIPINMRDGCILAVGKGNEEWNVSAPHGAGRLMSRSKAKNNLSLDEYRAEMQGVYSSSVVASTLDEAPMAYKPLESIISQTTGTVEVKKVLKAIYNFKAQ